MARHDHFDAREDLHRTADPRAARHHTHSTLGHLDPDNDPEPVEGRSMRSGNRTPIVEHAKGKLEQTGKGGAKVWKSPFWKRRSRTRRAKAVAVRELTRED